MGNKVGGNPLKNMDKAVRAAVKDGKLTKSEANSIASAAGKDVSASKTPGRTAREANHQASVLTTQSAVKFEPGARSAVADHTAFITANAAKMKTLEGNAKHIANAFAKDNGSSLALLGQPYCAVVPRSVNATDADGGSMQVGFDPTKLAAKYRKNPELLTAALEKLPGLLTEVGAAPKEAKIFRQHWAPYIVATGE